MNIYEIAWAAGFFDGEGGFYLIKRDEKYKRPLATVGQQERSSLERFQKAVGFGRIAQTKHPQTKSGYSLRWEVESFEKVQATIAMLWLFLCDPKKEQAKHVLLGMLEYRAMLPSRKERSQAAYRREPWKWAKGQEV